MRNSTSYRACYRKTRYASEHEAWRALIEISFFGTTAIKPIRVYECPLCHGWHLSKSPHYNPEGN